MPEIACPSRPGEWGTVEWFSRRFSSGDSADPTAYFSHSANGYQIFRHRNLCAWLRQALPGRSIESMLDIGCGTGVLTAMLAEQHCVPHAVGVDFLPGAIEEARRHYPAIEFATAALPTLGFAAESFDLVVASEVLYYLNDVDRRRAVDEIGRILRPNGVLFFTSRLGRRYFTAESAEQLLKTQFVIERQDFFHNTLYQFLMKPLRGARALAAFADGRTNGDRATGASSAPWFHFLLANPLSRFCVRQIGVIERRLLRSSQLPDSCHRLCKIVIPRWTRSNIILLAKKA